MNTISKNFGWVKDSIIIVLLLVLLINARLPETKTEYVPMPMYIDVDTESIEEVEVEKVVYIEVPYFIEVKPDEEKRAEERVIPYNTTKVTSSNGFKSYMAYTTITKKNSNQYKLQQWAHTDGQGFRILEGRFLIAVGTGVGAKVGQFVDVVLKNGTHIPAIVGDIKSDVDTDASNMFCSNGCCTEFIVDNKTLVSSVRTSGDCSSANAAWQSPVVAINVLDKSML